MALKYFPYSLILFDRKRESEGERRAGEIERYPPPSTDLLFKCLQQLELASLNPGAMNAVQVPDTCDRDSANETSAAASWMKTNRKLAPVAEPEVEPVHSKWYMDVTCSLVTARPNTCPSFHFFFND